MSNVFIFFTFIVFIVVGPIFLQVFMCKIGEKWLGLILPTITFLLSLIIILGTVPFKTTSSMSSYNENSEVIESYVYQVGPGNVGIMSTILMIVMIFVFCNIPTVIFVGIYSFYRKKKIQNNELNKMSIQDLE